MKSTSSALRPVRAGAAFALALGIVLAMFAPMVAASHGTVVVSITPNGGTFEAGEEISFAAGYAGDASCVYTNPRWFVDDVQVGTGGNLIITLTAAGTYALAHKVLAQCGTHNANERIGSASVTITAGPLAGIVVAGPEELVAGVEGEYAASGEDEFGNAVAIVGPAEPITFSSTVTGVFPVCYEEDGFEGCLDVTVVAADVVSIAVEGPEQLLAGEEGEYLLSGVDEFDNDVTLAQSSVLFSQTTVGDYQVCYEESAVTGCADVAVVPAAVDSFSVSPMSGTLSVGQTIQFSGSAADVYGNAIPIAWSAKNGQISAAGLFKATRGGEDVVTAKAGDQKIDVPITVLSHLVVDVAVAQASYTQSEALNDGVHGTVSVELPDGSAPAIAGGVVVFEQVSGSTVLRSTYVNIVVQNGVGSFQVPLAFRLVGDYKVTARIYDGGNRGDAATAFAVVL